MIALSGKMAIIMAVGDERNKKKPFRAINAYYFFSQVYVSTSIVSTVFDV